MMDSVEQQAIERLYRELSRAFPHPFDWMGLLAKPRFWRITWHGPHRRVRAIFSQFGFVLDENVARRFGCNPDSWETFGLDAGGTIICDLAYALDDQIDGNWRDLLCLR